LKERRHYLYVGRQGALPQSDFLIRYSDFIGVSQTLPIVIKIKHGGTVKERSGSYVDSFVIGIQLFLSKLCILPKKLERLGNKDKTPSLHNVAKGFVRP
jgi:hypothetical protein